MDPEMTCDIATNDMLHAETGLDPCTLEAARERAWPPAPPAPPEAAAASPEGEANTGILGWNEGVDERADSPAPEAPDAGCPLGAGSAAPEGLPTPANGALEGTPTPASIGTPLAPATTDQQPEAVRSKPSARRSPGQARWIGPAEPERPIMELLFNCIQHGRRYYDVVLNGQVIFVGTRPECDRFLTLHNEKVALEQAEERRTPRARPFPFRTYRAARA